VSVRSVVNGVLVSTTIVDSRESSRAYCTERESSKNSRSTDKKFYFYFINNLYACLSHL